MMGLAGHVACMGEMKSVYKALVVKPEMKRPLERPNSRWKDNIKVDFKEMVWERGLSL
jgi:hypothetical protein